MQNTDNTKTNWGDMPLNVRKRVVDKLGVQNALNFMVDTQTRNIVDQVKGSNISNAKSKVLGVDFKKELETIDFVEFSKIDYDDYFNFDIEVIKLIENYLKNGLDVNLCFSIFISHIYENGRMNDTYAYREEFSKFYKPFFDKGIDVCKAIKSILQMDHYKNKQKLYLLEYRYINDNTLLTAYLLDMFITKTIKSRFEGDYTLPITEEEKECIKKQLMEVKDWTTVKDLTKQDVNALYDPSVINPNDYLRVCFEFIKYHSKQLKVMFPYMHNGGGLFKYKNRSYKVHIGSRGGKYIISKGKKLYI